MIRLTGNVAIVLLAVSMTSMSIGQIAFVPVSTTVAPGGTITVNVVNNAAGLTSFKLDAIKVTGQITGVALGSVPNPPLGGMNSNGVLRYGTSNNIWISGVFGNVNLMGGLPVGSGVTVYGSFTINVSPTATHGSYIVIDDYIGTNPFGGPNMSTTVNSSAVTMASVNVEVVPEPVTLALLAAGTLMIARRRRAC